MASRKRVTLVYDPEQLAAVFETGQEAAFGARIIGLMVGGRGALDQLPLAVYGIECVDAGDEPAPATPAGGRR